MRTNHPEDFDKPTEVSGTNYEQLLWDRAESEAYQAECDERRWIPVTERLPEGIPQVLVSWQNVVEVAYCINGIWYDGDDNEMVFGAPEAWMLKPKPFRKV